LNNNSKNEPSQEAAAPGTLACAMAARRVKRITHKVIHIWCELFPASLQMKGLRRFLVVGCETFEHYNASHGYNGRCV
jgi:hypothetical protein